MYRDTDASSSNLPSELRMSALAAVTGLVIDIMPKMLSGWSSNDESNSARPIP
jgi:hypothetical protein